jgi:hypothetical protein
MGESLGTGIAIALAATHEAAALVLDSPYSSAVDVAAAHYPIFPVNWLMFDQFRSDLAIGDVHIPIRPAWRRRRRYSDKFGQAAFRTRQ